MSKKNSHIILVLILALSFSCQTTGHQRSKTYKPPKSQKSTDEYTTEQVDELLEKQQKNKNKKDKYERKRRSEEIKQIEKDAEKGNTDKTAKKKKLNDGEFKFY